MYYLLIPFRYIIGFTIVFLLGFSLAFIIGMLFGVRACRLITLFIIRGEKKEVQDALQKVKLLWKQTKAPRRR